MERIVSMNDDDGKGIIENVFRKYASFLCRAIKKLYKTDVP